MLGQPMFLPTPLVAGVRVRGALPPGTTATDLVLTLTQMLREHGVVGRFVEFFGDGCSTLELADRATPEHVSPSTVRPPRTGRWTRRPCYLGADRPRGPRGPRRALHERAGAVPSRRRPRAGVHRDPRARPRRDRAVGRRPQAAARPGLALTRGAVRRGVPHGSSPTPTRPTSAASSRRAGRGGRGRS